MILYIGEKTKAHDGFHLSDEYEVKMGVRH